VTKNSISAKIGSFVTNNPPILSSGACRKECWLGLYANVRILSYPILFRDVVPAARLNDNRVFLEELFLLLVLQSRHTLLRGFRCSRSQPCLAN